jgi:hypothetical protein
MQESDGSWQQRLEAPSCSGCKRSPTRDSTHSANVHDSKMFEKLIDGVEPIKRSK